MLEVFGYMETIIPSELLAGEVKLRSDELAVERSVALRHKDNYDSLKQEYIRVRSDFTNLERTLAAEVERSEELQRHSDSELQKLKLENKQLHLRISELEASIVESTNDKSKLVNDVLVPTQKDLESAKSEIVQNRAEFSVLKRHCVELQSEIEQAQNVFELRFAELRQQYDAEVDLVRQERESALKHLNERHRSELHSLRDIQKENIKLSSQVKELLNENEELQTVRENAEIQVNLASKLHDKQVGELKLLLQTIQTEKDSVLTQLASIQSELTSVSATDVQLRSKLHDVEQENSTLKLSLDELKHTTELHISETKINARKELGILERDHQECAVKIRGLTSELELAKQMEEQHRNASAAKEAEMVAKVQSARNEQWQKVQRLEMEKYELETRLDEKDKERAANVAVLNEEIEKLRQDLDLVKREKVRYETQLLEYRSDQEISRQHMRAGATPNSDQDQLISQLREEAQYVKEQISQAKASESDLNQLNLDLQKELKELGIRVESIQEVSNKEQQNLRLQLQQERDTCSREKSNYENRITELQEQVKAARKQIEKSSKRNDKMKAKCSKMLHQAKNRMELIRAEADKTEVENTELKKRVPHEIYETTCRQLEEFLKRNREYSRLLAADFSPASIGDSNFSAILLPSQDANKPLRSVDKPFSELHVDTESPPNIFAATQKCSVATRSNVCDTAAVNISTETGVSKTATAQDSIVQIEKRIDTLSQTQQKQRTMLLGSVKPGGADGDGKENVIFGGSSASGRLPPIGGSVKTAEPLVPLLRESPSAQDVDIHVTNGDEDLDDSL